jgi:hypothetical protein
MDGIYEVVGNDGVTRKTWRRGKLVEWDGDVLPLSLVCERAGAKVGHVVGRMWHGKTLDEALSMKAKARGSKVFVNWDGERVSLGALARRIGVHKDTLAMRVKRGWSLAEAVAGAR